MTEITRSEQMIDDARIKAERSAKKAAQEELLLWDESYENEFYKKGYTVKQVRQIKRRLLKNSKGVF